MSNFKITALGTVSPYPHNGSNCPGFLVEGDEIRLLLDAGSGIANLLDMKKDLINLKIFLSHLHWDHISELFDIGYATYLYNQKVEVYAPGNVTNDLEKIILNAVLTHQPSNWHINYISDDSILHYGNYYIMFLKTLHSDNSYAIKVIYDDKKDFKQMVYTSDIGKRDIDNVINFAQNSDLLICESSLISEHNVINENHLHAFESGMLAKEAKVKKLVLTHFWPEDDRRKYVKEAKINFANTVAAKEGDIYFI